MGNQTSYLGPAEYFHSGQILLELARDDPICFRRSREDLPIFPHLLCQREGEILAGNPIPLLLELGPELVVVLFLLAHETCSLNTLRSYKLRKRKTRTSLSISSFRLY